MPSVLLTTECPQMLPLVADASLTALVRALVDVSEVYHSCRAAALAGP